MPDWTKSMQQSFEYYIVDPGTWKDADQIDTVKSSIIERDSDHKRTCKSSGCSGKKQRKVV